MEDKLDEKYVKYSNARIEAKGRLKVTLERLANGVKGAMMIYDNGEYPERNLIDLLISDYIRANDEYTDLKKVCKKGDFCVDKFPDLHEYKFALDIFNCRGNMEKINREGLRRAMAQLNNYANYFGEA